MARGWPRIRLLSGAGVGEIPDGHRWDAPPKVRFARDSPLVGAVSSEPVSGMKRRASFLHFIPASRARTREGSHEKPATAGLSCREFVSEVKSRSLQEGFM
jgi:hypothetical protein